MPLAYTRYPASYFKFFISHPSQQKIEIFKHRDILFPWHTEPIIRIYGEFIAIPAVCLRPFNPSNLLI